MRLPRPNTVFSQVFALVLTCVLATLVLGLGVLTFSPPPPPATVSIASFVQAYSDGSSETLSLDLLTSRPLYWATEKGQAEMLIGASLASGIGVGASDVRVAITAPSLFGLLPASGTVERGQMTIIDVPASLRLSSSRAAFDMSSYLRNEAVQVPPFVAAIRQPDGRYLQMQPRERFPTAWQLRLLAIFALSLVVVAPIAWFGARRWTDTIRRLAMRVNRFDGEDVGASLTKRGDAEEVKALEQAFEALHARVRAHIDERTRMMMAVAHDLRTPLTSIRIRSEDVGERLRSGFVRDLARLEQMINGILGFARAQKASDLSDMVDVSRLAEDLVAEAVVQGADITLVSEPAIVTGSAIDLSRAIDNLILNARRYATSATVIVEKLADNVVVCVIDNGPGVPEEHLPRLTEPFFRVEHSRSVETGGIGLGLATVKAIVDAHGGILELENVADGFMVQISLPAHDRCG